VVTDPVLHRLGTPRLGLRWGQSHTDLDRLIGALPAPRVGRRM